METVLVTGGTGFIARWCIVQLLEQGHQVRTTVRDRSREHALRAGISEVAGMAERLTVVSANLLDDRGWDEAVAGCRYVLHPGSPLGGGSDASLIAAAHDGSLRVLAAAADAGVERVVLTSAASAASPASHRTPGVTDEELWTDPDWPGLDAHRRSKTVAEQAAWAFVDGIDGPMSLTTILPGAVLGPILGADNLGSVEVIARLLRGEPPRVPRVGLEVVDVRDVADAHLRAMTAPSAGGERFLVTGDLLWMPDIARLLRAELGADARRVPTRSVPDIAVRLMARQQPQLRGVLPGLGRRNRHTTAKARDLLGWSPRPAVDAVVDCARSLVAHGVAS